MSDLLKAAGMYLVLWCAASLVLATAWAIVRGYQKRRIAMARSDYGLAGRSVPERNLCLDAATDFDRHASQALALVSDSKSGESVRSGGSRSL